MDTTDNYLPVRGKLPKKTEIPLWHEKKIIAFLGFFETFVVDGKIHASKELRKMVEDAAPGKEYWEEFLARIDLYTTGKNLESVSFMNRLITFSRSVLTYLKTNPHLIQGEIEVLMKRNPRCQWALELFKIKNGLMAPTVVAEEKDRTDLGEIRTLPEASNKRPEVVFNESLMRMTTILRGLVKGIDIKKLKDMSEGDKLKYATMIMKAVGGMVKSYTPNKQVFTQININSAKRNDLEQAFLKYAEVQQNEE